MNKKRKVAHFLSTLVPLLLIIFVLLFFTKSPNNDVVNEDNDKKSDKDSSNKDKKEEYIVTWLNYDGSLLEKETYFLGDIPSYKGETPKKSNNGNEYYIFDGWDPILVGVSSDITYTAKYKIDLDIEERQIGYTYQDTFISFKELREENYLDVDINNGRINKINVKFNQLSPGRLEISNKILSLSDNAFKDCSSIKELVLPESIKIIGNSSFENCLNLESLNFDSSRHNIVTINPNSFKDCVKLKNISLPSQIDKINNRLFYNCTSITSFVLPNNIRSIQEGAFYNCTSLKNITFNNLCEYIQPNAFKNCTSLQILELPDSITTILYSSLENCNNLEYIVIPKKILIYYILGTESNVNFTIFYKGNINDYNNELTFEGSDNDFKTNFKNKTIYYSSDKIDDGYSYWHYVNNVPTIWE